MFSKEPGCVTLISLEFWFGSFWLSHKFCNAN